jgi:hypothetical protein
MLFYANADHFADQVRELIVNNQTSSMSAIRPGYVLDLSALHRKREPRTPDAEPPATDGEPE